MPLAPFVGALFDEPPEPPPPDPSMTAKVVLGATADVSIGGQRTLRGRVTLGATAAIEALPQNAEPEVPTNVRYAQANLTMVGELAATPPASMVRYDFPGGAEELPYRYVIRRLDGTVIAGLYAFKAEPLSRVLNKAGKATFTLPIDHNFNNIITIGANELYVYYGSTVIWAGVIKSRREDSRASVVKYGCEELRWYLTKRRVGRVGRRDHIRNPYFHYGPGYWSKSQSWPNYQVDTVTTVDGGRPVMSEHPQGRAMRMRMLTMPSTGLLNMHRNFMYQKIAWKVPLDHKEGDRFTLTAWCYLPSGEFRFPTMRFQDQGGNQPSLVNMLTSQAPGLWLEHIDHVGRSVSVSNVPITYDSPTDKWIKMVATVEVPRAFKITADGSSGLPRYSVQAYTQTIHARLYPVLGTVYWSNVHLYDNERLVYEDRDQNEIANGLITNIQDPDLGKSDLDITPFFYPTGVKRTKTYLFTDNQTADDAMDELQNLERGMDTDILVTPTQRLFVGYYPNKGTLKRQYELSNDSNILSWTVEESADESANSWTIVSGDDVDEQSETVAQDRFVYQDTMNLTFEEVIEATPGSAITSLTSQAQRALNTYKTPPPILSVVVGDDSGLIYYLVLDVGDRVPVSIKRTFGQVDRSIEGIYRIMEISLDPNTNQTGMRLVHESIAYHVGV